MTNPQPIGVAIADDHRMFRYGLTAALGATDVEPVGGAADGRELLTVVDQNHPDVVLTDLAMPGLSGTATQHLLVHHPKLGLLALTKHEDNDPLLTAIRAGARGCGSPLQSMLRTTPAVCCWSRLPVGAT